MRKHFILTSLAAIITTVSGANAVTDVTFAGDYTNTSGDTVNVADAVAAQSYSYEKSDGSTRNVASQATDPTLSDFTYTDKDGNDADLSTGTKVQSDFTGTTAAAGVVSTTQEIVSGANVVRDNYTYTNGAGDKVVLGTAAQDMSKTVTLDATYAGGTEIVVTNGTAGSAFDGTMYTVTIDGDDTYHLSADGTLLYHSNNTPTGDPEPGSALDTAFTAMKLAYNTNKEAVTAAETNTATQWATEQTNFGLANTAFTTDTATVAALDTRWGTYETAAGLLSDAQANQASAQSAYDANGADLANALSVYDAPITTTIDNRANDAIDTSVASGSIKTALDTKANSADVYSKDAADAKFLTEHQDISGKADTATVNSALALKANSADVYSKDAADAKFLTEHQDISGKADTATVNSALALKANSADVYDKDAVDGFINDEATARANADTTLQSNIDAEATARANADIQLQNQINQSIALADSQTLSKANSYTDSRVNTPEKNVSGGVAAATALSGISVGNVKKGEVSVGGGYGYYNNQSAMAFGAAMGLSDRWSVNAGAGIASGDKTQMTFRAGTNYKFKLF